MRNICRFPGFLRSYAGTIPRHLNPFAERAHDSRLPVLMPLQMMEPAEPDDELRHLMIGVMHLGFRLAAYPARLRVNLPIVLCKVCDESRDRATLAR